jgi:MFS family permease
MTGLAPRGAAGLGRGFRTVVVASACSGIGDGVVASAMPLLAASQTRSPTAVAGVLAAQRLPWLLLSLHSGALADRVDLRRLLPRVDAARAVLLGALCAAVAADVAVLPLLYLTALVVGAGDTTVATGLQAAVPRLVPDARLDRANAVVLLSQSSTEHLAGPALGGLLFSAAAALPFGVDALSFALSAVLLARGLPAGTTAPPSGASLSADVREALRWFRGDPGMRRMALLITTFSATQAAVLAVLVLLVTDVYGRSATTFGLVLAAAAVGNVAGSLVTERISRSVGVRTLLLVGGAATGLAYVVLGATRSPLVAAACLAVEGVVIGIASVAALTYRQRRIPPAMLGRVSAAFRMVVYGSLPLGALLAGLGAEVVGVAATVVAAGVVQVLAALLLAPRLEPAPSGGVPAPG